VGVSPITPFAASVLIELHVVLPCLTAKLFQSWIATDLPQCLATLRKNVSRNACANVEVEAVDWTQPPLSKTDYDVIFAVDVVFNESLALPLVQALSHFATPQQTLAVVALELRSSDMVETFLQTWLEAGWTVWRVDASCCLTSEMRENPHFVVWLGVRS
jgi:hypothetical protein